MDPFAASLGSRKESGVSAGTRSRSRSLPSSSAGPCTISIRRLARLRVSGVGMVGPQGGWVRPMGSRSCRAARLAGAVVSLGGVGSGCTLAPGWRRGLLGVMRHRGEWGVKMGGGG
jgi:hypothetical protein